METASDSYLIRYLLGELSEAEAGELDERSVTDEALAMRLRLLEDDLVDRYARGEALDVPLEHFARARAASAHLQEKVVFARALQAIAAGSNRPGMPSGFVASRRGVWSRGLAAAAALLVAATAYLGVRTVRLRDEIGRLDGRRTAAEHQSAELRRQLEEARAVPSTRMPTIATFSLRPPRRGPENDASVISVPHGTEQLTLRLIVESGNYTTFWAALRNAATARIVARTPDLVADPSGNDRIVTFASPSRSLETQRYSVELSGISSDAPAGELVAQYPVRIVLQ
jgi:hypothetical protein